MEIKCSTKDSVKLTDVVPFQGNLKKRTESDIKTLKESLLREGLLMPFAVWDHDGKKFLLDGHGRKEALVQLAVEDANLLTIDWPCIYVQADTEDDARKALLQITSSYGKITKTGVKQFCVSIPDYKAPSINKFVAKPLVKKAAMVDPVQRPNQDKVVLKVRIDKDKVDEVKDILAQFKFIEVL